MKMNFARHQHDTEEPKTEGFVAETVFKAVTAVYGYNPALFWVLSVSC